MLRHMSSRHSLSTSRVQVGCAGWSIPGRYRDAFGAGESALQRYATRFTVTEINSSFYRPHQPATYARWADAVPAHFRFSVKMPRQISHESRLQGVGPALDRFLGDAGHLGERLGGLLLQLPPSLAFDARSASTFFAMLRRRTQTPVACEARHASWFTAPAQAVLVRHGISGVATDPPRAGVDAVPSGTPAWPYWRWHGSPRIYYSEYPDEALQELARAVAAHGPPTGRTWVIFDNTAHGFAVNDALRLQALLEKNHA